MYSSVLNSSSSGPAGGDLSGTYPNPTVTTVLGKAISDASGNLLIGTKARLLAITNGFKMQVSTDGATWQDGPSYVAS